MLSPRYVLLWLFVYRYSRFNVPPPVPPPSALRSSEVLDMWFWRGKRWALPSHPFDTANRTYTQVWAYAAQQWWPTAQQLGGRKNKVEAGSALQELQPWYPLWRSSRPSKAGRARERTITERTKSRLPKPCCSPVLRARIKGPYQYPQIEGSHVSFLCAHRSASHQPQPGSKPTERPSPLDENQSVEPPHPLSPRTCSLVFKLLYLFDTFLHFYHPQ